MGLLTEANFFVVIIALIIIFFLLGFLIGRMTNRTSREKPVAFSNTTDEKVKPSNAVGQDNQIDDNLPDLRQDKRPNDSRNRYYGNYW